MSLGADAIRDTCAGQIEALAGVVQAFTDAELVSPTGCDGWLAAHLMIHVRLDAAELLACFTDPTEDPADRDFVSYWRDWPASPEPVTFQQVRFLWANAAAYTNGQALRWHFADTARAAAYAARTAPHGRFRFQGHVLTAEDLLGMWTTEFAVHHLDLIACLPAEGPTGKAVEVTLKTLDGLLKGRGTVRPDGWDDLTYVRKATGRLPLDAKEKPALGGVIPVFG